MVMSGVRGTKDSVEKRNEDEWEEKIVRGNEARKQ